MSFKDVKEKLMKASKGSSVFVLSEAEALSQKDFIATKAYDLNRVLSGSLWKGIPNKNLTFLVGPEASFKSSFMCLNLAEAQKKGYTPVILDAEQAWTPEFCKRWGLNPDEALIIPTMWVEDLTIELVRIIDSGVTKIALALDSIGALESKKIMADGKKGDVKADQGALQKKIKRLVKLLVGIVKLQDSFGFMSGHYYGNPSKYGDSEKIGGGFYPKLASDIIILLKKFSIYENPGGDTIAERGQIIGTAIKAATAKNRNYPPFQEATVNIDYKNGIDSLAGILDIAEDMGIIKQAGSWCSCEMLDLKVQGRIKFFEELRQMDYQPVLDLIEENLKDSGYSTFAEEVAEYVEQESQDESETIEEYEIQEIVHEEKETTKKKKPGRPKSMSKKE